MSSNGADGCGNKLEGEEIVDGPQPMRHHKPCETTPNSADQFWQSHQAEYEARGKRSADQVERVHRHNAACPALRDELDRRRSISKATAIKARSGINLGYMCSACLLQRNNDKRNKALKSKYQGKRNRQNKSRGKEYRSRCRRAIHKHKQYRLASRGCQCGIPAIATKTGRKYSSKNYKQSVKKMNPATASDSLELNVVPEKAKSTRDNRDSPPERSISLNENKSGSDVGSLKNVSTTEFSVSSYNTFPSMDHEPMV